ncbi:mannose-1-phosphate guanylyltransferase/mannose-6-phosphate isomerase [Psychrobium sp. 1_MG-2023]|uniref:mannose-1-phosphate guanylyltransferase/mannose-6-phosphate isomerase n=1 Tax=Psychrobium sp. 1_MG-2023 TaxID=3062624 RepID=UPI002732C281|nr:mannose-1-phosphate guanylyltransferase/mannose-6-phosphate isomerase [Psychrobium sp. 1_MG-2023]MDP2561111.1 mannose-1-phosphate guanylyltransferase/mannose-6-phosphate isomerase [Psychrobium sp. 1_MG-2023]
MLIPVVMAGGSGTRLWPLSRQLFPKQFLPLVDDSTMLQATLNRLEDLPTGESITICNEEHRFVVAEQLRRSGELGSIILEPIGRNTAPAVALAALVAQQTDDEPLLLVLAADHVIEDQEAFEQAVLSGMDLAKQGKMVTFGIVPTKPHTGYGYIKQGQPITETAYGVSEFVEKPDLETATHYVESREFLWNSGMFLFKASDYLKALEQFRPDILHVCQRSIETLASDLDFVRVDSEIFAECPDDSIDYAVMEPLTAQSDNQVTVVPLDAGWNDVGSWASLLEVSDKDQQGNHFSGDVIAKETKGTYVYGKQKLVTTLGVSDLIIVDTPDALLVSSVECSQQVKEIVDELKLNRREEATIHREVYRPWGKYDAIDNGERYQVKHITVKPGAKLSVQMHHHRAEHWIVVSGAALVTNGDEQFMLSENESTYIPIGTIHALENPGKIPLELIEVQSGSYLGEDDIVRFEDIYGRVESSIKPS